MYKQWWFIGNGVLRNKRHWNINNPMKNPFTEILSAKCQAYQSDLQLLMNITPQNSCSDLTWILCKYGPYKVLVIRMILDLHEKSDGDTMSHIKACQTFDHWEGFCFPAYCILLNQNLHLNGEVHLHSVKPKQWYWIMFSESFFLNQHDLITGSDTPNPHF